MSKIFHPVDEANTFTRMVPSSLKVYESSLSLDGQPITTLVMLDHNGVMEAGLRLDKSQVFDLIDSLLEIVSGTTLAGFGDDQYELGKDCGYDNGYALGFEIGCDDAMTYGGDAA